MRFFIDIETAPTNDPEIIRDIESGITAPSNYTKPDTIAQWMETKGQAAKREAVGRTALDAAMGSIISIAWATDQMDEPACLVRDPSDPTDKTLLTDWVGHIERTLKAAAIKSPVDGALMCMPEFYPIAHNATFDLGFLFRRLVINSIKPGFRFPSPASWRYGRDYGCTMVEWAGHKDRISLDRLCKALRLPSPKDSGIDGSNVGELWKAGELDKVREYNKADVIAVSWIWERLEAIRVAL